MAIHRYGESPFTPFFCRAERPAAGVPMDQPVPLSNRPSAVRRPLRDRMTVPALAFGGMLMAVMQTVVVPLLPDLPRLTGASPGAVSWMVTATLLSGPLRTPALGRPGDMY